jgi:hypothetical protein
VADECSGDGVSGEAESQQKGKASQGVHGLVGAGARGVAG